MKISPFRPVMYTGDLREFASPPFDTITPDQEARLKENRNNITYLTLPDKFDGPENAKDTLEEWIKSRILVRSEREMLIILVQEFALSREKVQRIGVIGLAGVYPDDGTIIPHEETFEGPVMERVNLMSELSCHLEPIFLAVMNNNFEKILRKAIWGKNADSTFEEPTGVVNYVYYITDGEFISKIQESVSGDKAIVADGHHRLKATRTIAEKSTGRSKEFWSNTMSYVTSVYDPGLLISGMHKLVATNYRLDDYMGDIRKYFDLSEKNTMDAHETVKIYNGKFYSLTPRRDAIHELNVPGNPELTLLPSSIVTEVILRKIMKLNYKEIESSVRYTPDLSFAVSSVDGKESSFAFIMPPWNKELFLSLALKGSMMPQKSTYFYPKIPSGIAINSLLI